jgi:hypothetical protein
MQLIIMQHMKLLLFYRYSGQKIFYGLMTHNEFDQALSRHLSPSVLPSVQEKIETMKKRVMFCKHSSSKCKTDVLNCCGSPATTADFTCLHGVTKTIQICSSDPENKQK